MNTKQTKKASLVESILNVVIGYVIAVASQMIIFPMYGFHLTLWQSLSMGVIFTFISIARSFGLRRFFEHLRVTGILK